MERSTGITSSARKGSCNSMGIGTGRRGELGFLMIKETEEKLSIPRGIKQPTREKSRKDGHPTRGRTQPR